LSWSNLSGQEKGLFSGAGLGEYFGGGRDKEKNSSPFSFHQGSVMNEKGLSEGKAKSNFQFPKFKLPKWEMPKLFQKTDYPKSPQLSDSTSKKNPLLFPKANLFPERSPNEPNFFQRMNSRTREIFGRSNESSNSEIGAEDSGFGQTTWDSITKGLGGKSRATESAPVQPQLRSARQPEGSSSKR
jgi:hypothetical protein